MVGFPEIYTSNLHRKWFLNAYQSLETVIYMQQDYLKKANVLKDKANHLVKTLYRDTCLHFKVNFPANNEISDN